MHLDPIKHFLFSLDTTTWELTVREFGTDFHAAVVAYGEAERAAGWQENPNIVLLGADSLETLRKTHSSYFWGDTKVEVIPAA